MFFNEKHLIELLEDLADSQNGDGCIWDRYILLERCLTAPKLDLDKFLDELSRSFSTYLPILQTFILHLYNTYLRTTPTLNLMNTSLDKFILMLITDVITKNLQSSDIPGFGELLHNCIELLWWNGNKDDNMLTIKHIFSTILDTDGVFGILISEIYGYRCLKRILFDFNMIIHIEQEKLLKAVDVIATLVKKCSEHKKDSPRFSKGFSIYKACTTLLETLRSQNVKNIPNNAPFLFTEYEQYFDLLKMPKPRKSSYLPNFLRTLEQRRIDSFQNLMEFSPCTSCHKQALTYFSRDKSKFNDDDKLGPWDILLSEDTIKDLRQLGLSSEIIVGAVMKKFWQLSLGEWDKHELRLKVQTHAIPVYEIELPYNDGLKILWQVDYGFSIRSKKSTQLVKIWAVTANKEQIHKILENLSIVHQFYTSRHLCVVQQADKNNVILPMTFGDEEEAAPVNGLHNSLMDGERLLEVYKMLVANKFVPFSKKLYKSIVLDGSDFIFQVSKKEYEIINCPTSAIIIGRSGTGKTTCIVFRLIASYFKNSQLCKMPSNDKILYKRQIFITVSPGLCYQTKKYFIRLRESAMLARKKFSKSQFREYKRKKEEAEAGYSADEDKEDDIPNSFHELADHYFPLFITYDKFSKMLQETYGIKNLVKQRKLDADDIDTYDKEEKLYQKSSFIKSSNFVDYNVFKKRYWPRLNCNFDCELVYAEFSIIKGSNPEVDFLSREDYRNISIKKYPVFSYNRDQIYNLFEKYETMKLRNCQYDSIDRTLAILRLAKKKTLGGPHIHEVYVDKCQDNNIVDLALILKVFDHANSVFLAGDIAQCIAKGSSFRFQDLNALMYKWEHTRAKTDHSNMINPKQFVLDVNYRSHNGILKLATSVIDLIWHFFPNSIDRLSHEHGKVDGPQPIFFDGFQIENLLDCEESECNADQVIIVRNGEAKSRLVKLIGRSAMVMTVYEANDMEFNDVLLYNFFTDSPACQKWKIILSTLRENSKGVQTFSHEKHYILSSELKNLYVAVTRARQRLWICDENIEYSMPIKMYWESLGIIKIEQSRDGILTNFAKKNGPYEWNQRGKNFFEQQKYVQDTGMYKEAGDVYAEHNMFENAARSYLKANMWQKAGEYFEKAKKHDDAALAYKDGFLKDSLFYEVATNFILKYKQKISKKTYRHVAHHIKVHYHANAILYGKFEEAVKIYEKLVNNHEDIRETLELLLYICRTNILKETMISITGPSTLQQYLSKVNEFIVKMESQLIRKSEKWNDLIEEFNLYSAYLDKDIDKIYECIQYFRCRKKLAIEFHAVNVWLRVLPQLSDIQIKHRHRERLQYLLWMCELTFPFIKNINNKEDNQIETKYLEDIFCVREVNDPQKRQIPFSNPLLHMMHDNKIEDVGEVMNNQHIYNVNNVHLMISRCLASRIFELIWDANQKSRNISDISSRICYLFYLFILFKRCVPRTR